MGHHLRFVQPSQDVVGWELAYEGPTGRLRAQGLARMDTIRARMKKLMQKFGPRQVTALVGCECTHKAVNREIKDMASERAFENLSGMLGISPLKLLKTAARFHPLNPLNPLSPQMLTFEALKRGSKLFRKRGGGGRGPQAEQREDNDYPQQSEDETPPDDSDTSQQEASSMGLYDIGDYDIGRRRGGRVDVTSYNRRYPDVHGVGIEVEAACALDGLDDVTRTAISLTPGGSQALAAMRLAKLAKSNNAKISNAARVLNKAKSGDPKELKRIALVKARAKGGDKEAKSAMKRLQKVNRVANAGLPLQPTGSKLRDLYRAGIH